jgi:hypothetical protein
VTRVLEGIIGVRVPPGVGAIEMRYRPLLLVSLTWVSWVTLLLTLGILAMRRASAAGSQRTRPT